MKNLNKFTKAELINKFKELQDNGSNNNRPKLVELLLTLKSILLKITFIAILIKFFKKYTFFNKNHLFGRLI